MDFTPSIEKIKRAERKLGNADALLREWGSAGVRFEVRRETHGARTHVIARVGDVPPQDVAFEIVEAVGHLRSALDKMVVALVEGNGRGLSGASFPFGGISNNGQLETFPSSRHDRLKSKLSPDQWSMILDQKPYPGGNDLLWSINEIANEDKHRRDLVKVSASLSVQSLSVSHGLFVGHSARPMVQFGGDPDFVCADGERDTLILSYAYSPDGAPPQIDQSIIGRVVFGKLPPVSGMSALGTLADQISLVRDIVGQFSGTADQ